jgi:hypothetical protein
MELERRCRARRGQSAGPRDCQFDHFHHGVAFAQHGRFLESIAQRIDLVVLDNAGLVRVVVTDFHIDLVGVVRES